MSTAQRSTKGVLLVSSPVQQEPEARARSQSHNQNQSNLHLLQGAAIICRPDAIWRNSMGQLIRWVSQASLPLRVSDLRSVVVLLELNYYKYTILTSRPLRTPAIAQPAMGRGVSSHRSNRFSPWASFHNRLYISRSCYDSTGRNIALHCLSAPQQFVQLRKSDLHGLLRRTSLRFVCKGNGYFTSLHVNLPCRFPSFPPPLSNIYSTILRFMITCGCIPHG